jgi:hypothetical protein
MGVLDPRGEYGKRLDAHIQTITRRSRQHILLGNSKLAVIAVGLLFAWLCFARHVFSAPWLLLPFAAYLALAVVHGRTIRTCARAQTAAAFYRTGLARIEDRWSGTGASGDRFRDEKHVYADDLDLFGRGSLFELLSTARLPMGENQLAEWLRSPSPTNVIVERQVLIQELRPKLDLRESLAMKGEELRVRLDPESLTSWCESEPMLGGLTWRLVAATLAIAAAATFVYWIATMVSWPFLVVMFLEAILLARLRRRATTVISGVNCNAEGLELFSRILHRLERESFTSPRLQQLVEELKQPGQPASSAVRSFARIVNWIDARNGLLAKSLNLPLLYSVQTALAAEAWRKRSGRRMRVWIGMVGEIEALLSLATYSFEHPEDPFPEFGSHGESQSFFAGEELGHPLIPASQSVRNSVRLDAGNRVLLVSGSNMSGKSTLLRTVGTNTVLALAGAPIRGRSLRLAPLSLGTRLRSMDSLQEQRSTFYTELLRIRQVFDLMNGQRPILFLFDELLDGTNSHDRQIGAECLIRELLERGAIGIVTTHDLALTGMDKSLGGIVHNSHFEDYVEGGQMRFDYKLRDGVVTKSNALELMRLVGLKL